MERNYTLPGGDHIRIRETEAIFTFKGPRAVLSTGALGGGLRTDLTAAFNRSDCESFGICRPMEGDNLQQHQTAAAKALGLDPARTTGLNTAANLDNMVVVTKQWQSLWVTAAISAGANVNALCAGDPAALREVDGKPCPVPRGTINIFLLTGSNVAPGAMAELLMVVTEAKTAVLRELFQESSSSPALATGTGTDGVVIVCGSGEENRLLNGGKHFKLGELAALAVREALPEALFRQTGLCADQQHSVLNRLHRFGITEDRLACACGGSTPAFQKTLRRLDRDSFLICGSLLYVHLMDQCRTGMLSPGEAEDWQSWLLQCMGRHCQCAVPAEGTAEDRIFEFFRDDIRENLRKREELYGSQPPI